MAELKKLADPRVQERKRIPLTVPVQRLEVPAIDGYRLYWFKDTPDRIQRAIAAGYEFVDSKEVQVNNVGLGNSSAQSGNTDLGSRVTVVAGGTEGNQASRLVLMKIRQEWHEEDLKLLDEQNAKVADALTGGLIGSDQDSAADRSSRYVGKDRTKIPDLFKRKH